METRPVRYILEIYQPNSLTDVLAVFTTTSPFVAPRAGEEVHPMPFVAERKGMALRVAGVERAKNESSGEHYQKLMVYTTSL